MTRAIVAAVLLATACGGSELTEVTTAYSLDGPTPTCADAREFNLTDRTPQRYECWWFGATYEGRYYDVVVIAWDLQDVTTWVEARRILKPGARSPLAEDREAQR